MLLSAIHNVNGEEKLNLVMLDNAIQQCKIVLDLQLLYNLMDNYMIFKFMLKVDSKELGIMPSSIIHMKPINHAAAVLLFASICNFYLIAAVFIVGGKIVSYYYFGKYKFES